MRYTYGGMIEHLREWKKRTCYEAGLFLNRLCCCWSMHGTRMVNLSDVETAEARLYLQWTTEDTTSIFCGLRHQWISYPNYYSTLYKHSRIVIFFIGVVKSKRFVMLTESLAKLNTHNSAHSTIPSTLGARLNCPTKLKRFLAIMTL